MIIEIFHNIHENAFFGLNTELLTGGGKLETPGLHPLVLTFRYWLDPDAPEAADPLTIAEGAFHRFNVDEPDAWGRAYRHRRNRSLSVGDVLSIRDGGRTRWFSCESAGWLERDEAVLNILTDRERAEELIRGRFQIFRPEPLSITVPLELEATTEFTGACDNGHPAHYTPLPGRPPLSSGRAYAPTLPIMRGTCSTCGEPTTMFADAGPGLAERTGLSPLEG